MEYITVREAAQKWGISVRLVQRHCAEGRVEGARKFGGTWAIPAKASKPEDPRRKGGSAAQACPPPSGRQACGTSALLMPLLNTAFVPGSCLRSIEAMQEGPQLGARPCGVSLFQGGGAAGRADAAALSDKPRPVCTALGLPDLCLCQSLGRANCPCPVCTGAGARPFGGHGAGYAGAASRCGGVCGLGRRGAFRTFPCPKSCRTPGNISPAAAGPSRLCNLCAGAQCLSAGGLRQKPRHGRGHAGHAGGKVSHPGHLPASGGGDGLHEPASDGTGKAPSACGLGDRPARRFDRGLRGAPRPAGQACWRPSSKQTGRRTSSA